MLNVAMLSGYAECHYSEHCYAECRYTCIVMLSVFMLIACKQNFVILSAVILFASIHSLVILRALYWS
jgi:hypothetical protein